MHIIAAKAVCFKEALQPSFKEYQAQIVANAKTLAEELMARGYRLVSGGTDNHLMLVDLRPQEMTGKEAQALLEECGITVNKNTIPFDPQKPFVTSGIRIGTPAVTTRGMKEKEMREIARFIDEGLKARGDEARRRQIREEVREFCSQFPLFAW
jgi:glycine hydroxymethyltransferase